MTDSKATYDALDKPGATQRTRYFDRATAFIRKAILELVVEMHLVTTDLMMADFGTKALEKTGFRACRKYVMNLPDYETGKVTRILRKLAMVLNE